MCFVTMRQYLVLDWQVGGQTPQYMASLACPRETQAQCFVLCDRSAQVDEGIARKYFPAQALQPSDLPAHGASVAARRPRADQKGDVDSRQTGASA
jgi:hypothetical protein